MTGFYRRVCIQGSLERLKVYHHPLHDGWIQRFNNQSKLSSIFQTSLKFNWDSLSSQIFIVSRTTRPVSTKFSTKYPCVKGIQFNPIKSLSFLLNTGSISTKLCTIIFRYPKGIQVCSNEEIDIPFSLLFLLFTVRPLCRFLYKRCVTARFKKWGVSRPRITPACTPPSRTVSTCFGGNSGSGSRSPRITSSDGGATSKCK